MTRLEHTGELDFSKEISGIRCRCHVFKQQGKLSAAVRLLSEVIPRLDSLGLPPSVPGFTKLHKGIVLVTGETGSGKSTTLAALLNEINHTRKDHIVTLEDPIEYIYTPDQCLINQREIGRDTASFSEGLRASLREDPDVILIGEMRDRDTIETAITAAETGHLVFGTLHTDCASDAIDRIVQVFPEGMQNQIRLQLSMTLVAVIAQQLTEEKDRWSNPGKRSNGRDGCHPQHDPHRKYTTDCQCNLHQFCTGGTDHGSVSGHAFQIQTDRQGTGYGIWKR